MNRFLTKRRLVLGVAVAAAVGCTQRYLLRPIDPAPYKRGTS